MGIMNDLTNPIFVWFLVGLAMFVFELVSPGLILFFFGIGAWVVSILTYFFPITINQQLLLFIVISLVTLFSARRRMKTLFLGFVKSKQNPQEDLDDFIGKKVEVKEKISGQKPGRIELNGTTWSAESDEEISVGAFVRIVSKENLTFKVKKI